MILLALDTSTERAIIGLESRSGTVVSDATESGRRHGRDLVPRLAAVLRAAGLNLRDLDGLAVGIGPGSYTGLRVGLMAAKTLAYATGVPLVGLDSLEAVARNAPATATQISVIGDAQRGQLYVAEYARVADGHLVCTRTSRIEPFADWLARLEPTTLVLGPGLDSPRIRAGLPEGLVLPDASLNYPDGHRLIELAHEKWAEGRRDDPWLLEPLYLRQSSAEEQWDARNLQRHDPTDSPPA